jgi:hypothetical protein
MKVFCFHYNKPEANRQGKPVLTVHQSKQCMLVHHITCEVPVATHLRNSQPRCVMKGRGFVRLEEKGGEVTAHITSTPQE